MNGVSPESGPWLNAPGGRGRIRRITLLISAAVGLALLAPTAASSTSAAGDTRVDRPAQAERFEQAVRRGSTAVRQPTPPPDTDKPSGPEGDEPPRLTELEQFALEVVRLTNAERAAAGVAPVALHPKLALAAGVHADDIAGKECKSGVLSHTGSDGSSAGTRILRTGLSISRWSENIACAHKSPEFVVKSWMNSSGHRTNLLDPRHTHIGVDVEENERGILFWVQNFATVK